MPITVRAAARSPDKTPNQLTSKINPARNHPGRTVTRCPLSLSDSSPHRFQPSTCPTWCILHFLPMANKLNTEFIAQPDGLMKFLCKYPLEIDAGQFAVPPDEEGEVLVGTAKVGADRAVVGALKSSSVTKTKKGLSFEVIQNKARPVFCDFALTTSGPNEGIVFPKLYKDGHGDFVKLFYLPWDSDKRHAVDLTADAPFSMTASMHGCRFEVHKKADNVYHVSHSNVQPKGDEYDAQDMIPYLRMADTDRGTRKLKFGKDRYFADATKLMGTAKQRMIHWGVATDDVLEAEPQTYKANVLGAQGRGGNWTFYYQLWGWVKVRLHDRVKKNKWLGLKTEYVDKTNDAYLKVIFLVQKIHPTVANIYKLHKTAKDPYS